MFQAATSEPWHAPLASAPPRTPSLRLDRPFNSAAALIAAGLVVVLQLLFAYASFMKRFFGTRPVDFVHGTTGYPDATRRKGNG
jgi:hypothetical protein